MLFIGVAPCAGVAYVGVVNGTVDVTSVSVDNDELPPDPAAEFVHLVPLYDNI